VTVVSSLFFSLYMHIHITNEMLDERKGLRTNLCPDHLCQSTNELRCRIAVASQRFFIDNLAYGVPEGGFEALEGFLQ
jgi:hypothetical protein